MPTPAFRPEANVARDFGAIVHQNEFSVTRVKTIIKDGRNATQITVHKKTSDGLEQLPRGYVLGTNMLRFDE